MTKKRKGYRGHFLVGHSLFSDATHQGYVRRSVGGQPSFVLQILKSFAQESRGPNRTFVDFIADLRRDYFHNGLDKRPWRVIFTAVATGVAYVLDLGFVEMRHFMLLFMRTKAQLIDPIDDFAEIVAALDLVFQLAKNFADLIFNGVGIFGVGFELFEVGKELLVNKVF